MQARAMPCPALDRPAISRDAGVHGRDDPPEKTSASDQSIARIVAENAAAFRRAASQLREEEGADRSFAPTEDRFRREAGRLGDFPALGLPAYSDGSLEEFPLLSNNTSEHQVRDAGERVIKVTHPGFYGQIPILENGKLQRRIATPSEYLERMALQNEVFGSDLKLEGVNISSRPSMVIGEPAGQPSFVISQKHIIAVMERFPHPPDDLISQFLISYGFVPAPASYFGWIRLGDGIALVDARPDNFIMSTVGVIPIDLQMAQIAELFPEE